MILASTVLMVRPAAFGFSEEAAGTNVFQERLELPPHRVAELAVAEFDTMVGQLRAEGIDVRVVEDTPEPPKPDAVFPNNWVSWFPGGSASVVLYPMAVPSRRLERRVDVVGDRRVLDLSGLEASGAFVEGTGSLVFDHEQRVAYACRSPRTTEAGVHAVCEATGYTPVLFDAALDGAAVYHTNVVLGLGPGFAVWFGAGVAAGALPDEGRAAVERALHASGRSLVQLNEAQVRAYCGNVLTLLGAHGPVTVLSRTAWEALGVVQRDRLGRVLVVDIPTIEHVGGGSARCMLAEVFNPG